MSTKILALLLLSLYLVLGITFYVNDIISSAKKISVELSGIELKGVG